MITCVGDNITIVYICVLTNSIDLFICCEYSDSADDSRWYSRFCLIQAIDKQVPYGIKAIPCKKRERERKKQHIIPQATFVTVAIVDDKMINTTANTFLNVNHLSKKLTIKNGLDEISVN